MAGLTKESPSPTAITVHQQSRVLEVGFSDGASFRIPFELMRIYSPSAEVQGHGPGQEVLQTGKRDVELADLKPVGNYGVQPTFSDGHDTGIFSWDYLYFLGSQQQELWGDYARAFAKKAGPTGRVVHTDINESMLRTGRDRLIDEGIVLPTLVCDAEKLPFADESFDVVSVAFGLRNMTHKDAALAEMNRV